jgi:hypothetical protein
VLSSHSNLRTLESLAPASFCKCTCFSNSTIIDLGAPSHSARPHSKPTQHASANRHVLLLKPRDAEAEAEAKVEAESKTSNPVEKGGRTCADCNRQFCIDYHLPFCAGAKEEDVFATCFRELLLLWSPSFLGGFLGRFGLHGRLTRGPRHIRTRQSERRDGRFHLHLCNGGPFDLGGC